VSPFFPASITATMPACTRPIVALAADDRDRDLRAGPRSFEVFEFCRTPTYCTVLDHSEVSAVSKALKRTTVPLSRRCPRMLVADVSLSGEP